MLRIFSVLWAIAVLFHYQAFSLWSEGVYVWIIAIYIICYPRNRFGLILLALAQIIEAWVNAPIKNNHWMMMVLVNLTILICYCDNVMKEKRFIPDEQLMEKFAPLVKKEVVMLYFFAFLHKLNYDFLDRTVSCASAFYRAYLTTYTAIPYSPFMEQIMIYGTLTIEFLIAILLMFNKTQTIAALLGFVFHTIIAYNPLSHFWNFSSIMFPLLYLFFDKTYSESLISYMKIISTHKTEMILCLIPLICLIMDPSRTSVENEVAIGISLWSIYCLFILESLLNYIKLYGLFHQDKLITRKQSFSLYIPLLLMCFNGFNPYLNLNTESTFSMYSNLRSENHLFIPNMHLNITWLTRFTIRKPIQTGNISCTR
ncbi:MAG: hypothetical protein Harvfovirus45_2 [Harvfovirus sp.]|uniref:HTTM domain-containing protein n=1 Tax=Harvfovirus sp. TaxID=2487768 RepID=A0A3G5A327_9VIRU|nr:MAG: hypothetical protein Harvfovirus45_2 [Harvfovirus sp.]